MKDPNRIPEVIERLQKVWEKHPHLRLGQLISNVYQHVDLYYEQDDNLIDGLEIYYDKS